MPEKKCRAGSPAQECGRSTASPAPVSPKRTLHPDRRSSDALTTRVGKEYNRAANLALEAFYSSEECRILIIYTLRLLIGDDDLLGKIVEDARSEAQNSLKRYAYAEAPEWEDEYEQNSREEVVN